MLLRLLKRNKEKTPNLIRSFLCFKFTAFTTIKNQLILSWFLVFFTVYYLLLIDTKLQLLQLLIKCG